MLRSAGAVTTTYDYDHLDRLTQVAAGGSTTTFAYNGDGVRVAKTAGGAPTGYVQDLAAPLPVVLVERTGGQDARAASPEAAGVGLRGACAGRSSTNVRCQSSSTSRFQSW